MQVTQQRSPTLVAAVVVALALPGAMVVLGQVPYRALVLVALAAERQMSLRITWAALVDSPEWRNLMLLLRVQAQPLSMATQAVAHLLVLLAPVVVAAVQMPRQQALVALAASPVAVAEAAAHPSLAVLLAQAVLAVLAS